MDKKTVEARELFSRRLAAVLRKVLSTLILLRD